ncbi:MAG: HAD family hydrolase [Gammaproteobacteria bacterium]|nr:HAD family hydrolase [Gammaproteobacteria bacterium]
MKNYELIVFDWDGTLVDSIPTVVANFQSTARAMQLEVPTREQIEQQIGLEFNDIVTSLFGAIDMTCFSQFYNEIHNTSWQRMRPFAGALNTLKYLDHAGYTIAVATNRCREQLQQMLNNLQLQDFFAMTICGDEASPKPDPAMLLQILETLNISPTRALMVGDSLYDIQFANNAGVDLVAVNYGAQNECLSRYAEINLIKHLSCLQAFL